MFGILFTENSLIHRNMPVNSKVSVQNTYPPIRLWSIKVVTFILEDSFITQYGKTVCKTSWYKELTVIIFCKFYCYMFSVSRRIFSYIYSYIKHSTFNHSYKLALSKRRTLEMQPTHHAIARHALVVLHKLYLADFLFKLPLRERFKEIPSRILEDVWFDDYHALYIGFDYVHFFN